MRDAFGGIVNIAIIVVFLVIVSGYLAFNVNYTKAFRVKNKIITTYEQYEGNCKESTTPCADKIKTYMSQIGYNAPEIDCDGWNDGPANFGYCAKKVDTTSESPISDSKERAYYKIKTQINIDIPIINKIMPGLRIFEVTGDTKVIEK